MSYWQIKSLSMISPRVCLHLTRLSNIVKLIIERSCCCVRNGLPPKTPSDPPQHTEIRHKSYLEEYGANIDKMPVFTLHLAWQVDPDLRPSFLEIVPVYKARILVQTQFFISFIQTMEAIVSETSGASTVSKLPYIP